MNKWSEKYPLHRIYPAFLALISLLLVAACVDNRSASSEPFGTVAMSPQNCGETRIIGTASGVYADRVTCAASAGALQTSALQSGESECSSFCGDMNCKWASTVPPPTPTATCTARHPVTGQSFGMASTGQFVCRCVIE